MAFKKMVNFGRTVFTGIGVIKKIKFSSKLSPITAELHVIPDKETYEQLKDEERGFKINEKGEPLRNAENKIIGVIKTLDYDKTLLRIETLNSRDLGPEKDMAFRKEVLALFYKYFAIDPESGLPLEEI